MLRLDFSEKSPHSDDFTFKTSVNEKTYNFSLDMSGVFWALGIYFFLKDSVYSGLLTLMSVLFCILIPYLFFTKKDKIQRQGAELYALDHSSWVIVADFLSKYVIYGLAACFLGLADKLEKGDNILFVFLITVFHVFMFWITRQVYWRYGEEERKRVSVDNA